MTRKTLSAVLNERAGISPAMAHRLSKALDTTAEFWINLQAQYDLWQGEKQTSVPCNDWFQRSRAAGREGQRYRRTGPTTATRAGRNDLGGFARIRLGE